MDYIGKTNGSTGVCPKFENRAIAVIDLDKLAVNVHNIKSVIGKQTKLLAVVKADAYGHGAVESAKTLIDNGVDYLGVATLEEGAELRCADITAPILVLGYVSCNEMKQALEYDMEMTIFDMQTAKKLSAVCKEMNKPAKIHIKIDTGMGRIGFLTRGESIAEIVEINSLPYIEITGIYTHLAESDSSDKSYAKQQFEKFMNFIKKIEAKGVVPPIKHVSNSGAIIDLPEFDLDMVRAGIILYGLKPSGEVNFTRIQLQPVLQWKSYLSFVKTLGKGESIGYGRAFVTKQKTAVGTVPIGYADGFSRSLGNCGKVLVKGQIAPIIGRICMDQFMVDLSGVEAPEMGDEVVLIGNQGGEAISAEEVAALRNTINYEVLCNISRRVKRIYTKK